MEFPISFALNFSELIFVSLNSEGEPFKGIKIIGILPGFSNKAKKER
jgi:hypothetical protein